jgi:hypothetical protein
MYPIIEKPTMGYAPATKPIPVLAPANQPCTMAAKKYIHTEAEMVATTILPPDPIIIISGL